MKRKPLIILLVILLFNTAIIHNGLKAETIAELEEQIAELEAENEKQESEGEQAREKLDDYESKLVEVQNEISTLKTEISDSKEELQNLKNELVELQNEIDELKNTITEKKVEADESLVLIQQVSLTNILSSLKYGSITDYIKYNTNMLVLETSLTEPLVQLIDLQLELEQKEEDYEYNITKQELTNAELDSKKIKLEKQEEDFQYYIEQQKEIVGQSEEAVDDAQSEIDTQQDIIDFYASQGCEENDVYGVDCGLPPEPEPVPVPTVVEITNDEEDTTDTGSTEEDTTDTGSTEEDTTDTGSTEEDTTDTGSTEEDTTDTGSTGGDSSYSGNGVVRPMSNAYITCEYGGYSGHTGIDLGTKTDKTIYPIYPGQVVSASYHSQWGNNVLLIHSTPNGIYFTRYSHMTYSTVSPGQQVNYSTPLGYMGETGTAQGAHLHLEIYRDSNNDGIASYGEKVDPRIYVDFPNFMNEWYDRSTYYGGTNTGMCV